jgi:hypothetical protein
MKRNHAFKLSAQRLLMVGLFAYLVEPARLRADQTWTNLTGSGNEWNTAGNWSGGTVPGLTDNAWLTNTTASYTVNYTQQMAAANFLALTVSNAPSYTTTLNINTNGFVSKGTSAGLLVGSNGTINIGASGNAMFGGSSSFHGILRGGALNLNGGTATFQDATYALQISGQATVNSGRMTVSGTSGGGWVARLAIIQGGTLTINGGLVNSLNCPALGLQDQNSGTLTMTGGTLTAGGTYATDFIIGGGNASGTANISGGTVTNYGALSIAVDAYAAAGTLNLSGGRWVQVPTYGGIVRVADKRGAGSLNITGSGQFTTPNNTTLGDCSGGANDTASGTLLINGGTYVGTNTSGTATLTVRRGEIKLQSGTLTVDSLVATNGATLSKVTFTGGTLYTKGAVVSNATVFTVGNGTNAAMLGLLTGSHTFNDGLTIASNGVFAVGGTNALGTATVAGNVTLQTGAVLDCDYTASTNDWAQITGTLTLPVKATLSVRTLDASLRSTIPVLQATTIIGDATGWSRVQVNGRDYRAVVSGNQLQLQMPLGTLVTIK